MPRPVPSGSAQIEPACLILHAFGHEVVAQVSGVANLAHALSENANSLRGIQFGAKADRVVGMVEAMRAAAVAFLEDRPMQLEPVDVSALLASARQTAGGLQIEGDLENVSLLAHPVLLERVIVMLVDAVVARRGAVLSMSSSSSAQEARLQMHFEARELAKVDRWPLIEALCAAQGIKAERQVTENKTLIDLTGRRAGRA